MTSDLLRRAAKLAEDRAQSRADWLRSCRFWYGACLAYAREHRDWITVPSHKYSFFKMLDRADNTLAIIGATASESAAVGRDA